MNVPRETEGKMGPLSRPNNGSGHWSQSTFGRFQVCRSFSKIIHPQGSNHEIRVLFLSNDFGFAHVTIQHAIVIDCPE
jgi:hypothetical protein